MDLIEEHETLAEIAGANDIATMMVLLHVIKTLRDGKRITDVEYQDWQERLTARTAVRSRPQQAPPRPTQNEEPADDPEPARPEYALDTPSFRITRVLYRGEWRDIGPSGLARL